MFGLFVIVIIGVIFLKEMLTNAFYDGMDRQKARDNGLPYYTDSQGTRRRVDNNHKVLEYVVHFEDGSWDKVDEDAVTGQILRNYSQEKRNKEAEKEKERIEKNRKSKEEAIKNGRYQYSSLELGPSEYQIKRGEYNYIVRRCSDDLMVEGYGYFVVDARCGFVLWRHESEYEKYPTLYSLDGDKQGNKKWFEVLCKDLDIMNRVTHEFWKPTKEELIEYVKKIKPLGYEDFIE